MPRAARSLAALAALAALAGAVAAADEKMPDTPYYPLVVGNTWHYRAGDNRFQLKVAEIKSVDGKPRAKIDLVVNDKAVSFEQVGVTKDGVVRYTFEGKEAKPPIEFLKVPPKADASWKIDSEVIDKAGKLPVKGTFKIGKEEDVKVPAGTYKAVPVSGQDIDANGVRVQKLTYYFAAGVGMVKQVIEMEGNKIQIELEKYEPAGAKK
jgi:hypothetical protein